MSTSPKRNRIKSRRPKASGGAGSAGQVRIIAGHLRGRKLTVPDVDGLRPTGDRVRETLFNWLQADIAGACCLDLFAGSGALGFEALSRYAQNVTFVEPNPSAFRNLSEICRLLEVPTSDSPALSVALSHDTVSVTGANEDSRTGTQPGAKAREATAHLFSGTAQAAIDQWASKVPVPLFDLVFIDPPFQMGCQWDMLSALVPRFLSDNALVYIEAPTAQSFPVELPLGCELIRNKSFSDVTASLVRYAPTR